MKNFVTKHLLLILCIISLIALLLPFGSITAEVEVMGYSGGSDTQTMNGLEAVKEGILGYLLIIGPVLLIVMNYIKKLEPHKGLLAIIVPIICLVVLVIVGFKAKGYAGAGNADAGAFTTDVEFSIGFGAILLGLSYIGTLVAGAVIYHNFTFDKAGLERLKEEGKELIDAAQNKISNIEFKSNASDEQEKTDITVGNGETAAVTINKTKQTKSLNVKRTDEVLQLIEKLAEMRERGILTEEEFSEKKQQLLEEI